MGYFKTLCYLFVFCILVVERDAELTSVEDLVRQELDRFATIQDALEQANLNMTVVLWHLTNDENGTEIQLDSIEFFSHGSKFNPSGPQVEEKLSDAKVQEVFAMAKRLDMTAVVSQEKYLQDGSLFSKDVYVEDIEIHYEDGNSHVIFEETEGSMSKDETSFQNYFNILRDYELPVEVTIELYTEEGQLTEHNTTSYKPRKVKIGDSDQMPVGMQMKAAEALKRAFIMKHSDKERMALICRYLGIQFSDYKWQAVTGDGAFHIKYDVCIKLQLDGDTYTIWGQDITEDEEE